MTPENGHFYQMSLTPGTDYFWCACGKSSKIPLCDGSHRGCGIKPLPFRSSEATTVDLCGCQKTQTAPYCDHEFCCQKDSSPD